MRRQATNYSSGGHIVNWTLVWSLEWDRSRCLACGVGRSRDKASSNVTKHACLHVSRTLATLLQRRAATEHRKLQHYPLQHAVLRTPSSFLTLYVRHCCFVVGCGLITRSAEPAAQTSMPAQLLLSHTSTPSHCYCAKRGASAVSLSLVRLLRSFN